VKKFLPTQVGLITFLFCDKYTLEMDSVNVIKYNICLNAYFEYEIRKIE
jgi:hypothetical protein